MRKACVVYGATGFTGERLVRLAHARGLPLVLAGRTPEKLRALGEQLGLPHCALDLMNLAQQRELEQLLAGASVVLNAAGPFAATAPTLIEACLAQGVHYLDITGEVMMIDHAAARSVDAKRRGIMLMPGVGFDVVASDCLAAHVSRRVPRPRALHIALSGLTWPSRGSARTMIDLLDQPTWARRNGLLCEVPSGERQRLFDFGGGARPGLAVAWGDVVSAYYSTGIANITTYFEATSAVRTHRALMDAFGWAIPLTPWQSFLHAAASWLPAAPSEEQLAHTQAVVVAEVEDAQGRVARSRLRTPEVYAFTATLAAALIERTLQGDTEPGFQTACRLYGPDYVLQFKGVTREDL